MSVSLPLVGRESLKLVKVDDLWAVDNDDDDADAVVKCADESGSFFVFAICFSFSVLFTILKLICMQNVIFVQCLRR